MKKLIILLATLSRGGAERVSVCLGDYFVRNGVPCSIVTMGIGKDEYEAPAGVERICVQEGNVIQKISGLRKVILQSQADTLLVMGTPLCMFAVPACAGLKIRVVVSERNDPRHFLGKSTTKIISRFLMKGADDFVFQTEDAKAYYAKSLRGRGTVIFNPLLTERLPDVYIGPRRKEIVTMGRLVPQKNQKMLIRAFAGLAKDYPEHSLTIYGDGPLKEELQSLAVQTGLGDRIQFPGNKTDVLEKIRDAAMFVMSSDFEGMPNALIEAMAIGMPCVCTDCPCGGPRELILPGKNGVLVPVDDANAMEQAMRELLANAESAAQLGREAVAIRERLHVDRIGRQWMKYLSKNSR